MRSLRRQGCLPCLVLSPRDAPFLYRGYPPPPFSVSAYFKGVTRRASVSAESKGVICTKIVQESGVLGTAHSKGLSSENERAGNKKAAVACRLSMDLYVGECN